MLSAWLVLAAGLAAVRGDSLVVSTEGGQQPQGHGDLRGQADKPDVYSLHITSHIRYRYASTMVSSRVANRASQAQEVFFSFVMPETAFISGFLMEIDGVVYKAHVKEKEEAKREYQEAVSRGQSAAHVAQSARNSNRFQVSVNIEAQQKVIFNLTYEELLKRQLSFYTHAINIDPGQVVHDLSVDVVINESSPIKTLRVPVLRQSNEIDDQLSLEDDPIVEIEVSDRNSATVHWAPTEGQQRELKAEGVKGQLVVQYDLDRSENPEQILVNEGYFVHFFSPEDLTPLPKHVVFVMDVSGSMYGRKIEQLRGAMTRILSDLAPYDFFSFVTFSSDVKVWDVEHHLARQHSGMFGTSSDEHELRPSSVVEATLENVNKAKEFVSRLETYSSTNIHGALMKGLQVVQLGTQLLPSRPEPMIIFLTDGQANVGESNPDRIVASISDANTAHVAIFNLAIGNSANLPFLKKLSLKNSGFARKIYEASDAALQLWDFYRQVASPLLANVTFEYTENQVDEESLSTTKFRTLFRGSELVVAGKLTSDNVTGVVSARGANGSLNRPFRKAIFPDDVPEISSESENSSEPSFMERLWGYMTIQQLLERETADTGDSNAQREKALNLALRYSFVTPLTSLVVVKPNETSSVDTERGDLSVVNRASPRRSNFHLRSGLLSPSRRASQARLGPSPRAGWNFQMARYPNGGGIRRHRILGDHIGVPRLGMPSETSLVSMTASSGRVSTGLQVVPLNSVSWVNNSGSSASITLRENPGSRPEILLLKMANEPNEAFSECNTRLGGPGHCRHLVHCALNTFQSDIFNYYPFLCRIGSYAGVCCPDSLQPVAISN